VTAPEVVYEESVAARGVRSLPLAHLSIELGHLYMEDLVAGPERVRELFAQVRPWAQAAQQRCRDAFGPKARISTCFLLDDYFSPDLDPSEIVPMVLQAANEADLRIDYLARESGCAEADGIPLAELVQDMLIDEPPPGATGGRPLLRETGWLCNGQRSPVGGSAEATERIGWRPPAQNVANPHSIFIDVQLWDEPDRIRRWSCPMLAAVWQLLRLGVLRHLGEPVAVPVRWSPPAPSSWALLPAVMQLTDDAAPFSAYRTYSALPHRFMTNEGAGVRAILTQVSVDDEVTAQLLARARGEQLALPLEITDRIEYTFVGAGWRLPSSVR
jgi:hypothetical protein